LKEIKLKYLIPILAIFLMIGCEGKQGPVGPSGSVDYFKSLMPFNPQPADGENHTRVWDQFDGNVLLTWSLTSNQDDEIKFDVYIGDSIPPTLVVEDTSDKYALVRLEQADANYVWQVVVKNGINGSISGPLWRFRLIYR